MGVWLSIYKRIVIGETIDMTIEILLACTFFVFALILTIVDWVYMILPTRIIYWGSGIGLAELIVQSILQDQWYTLGLALLGSIIGYVFFALIFYGSKWLLKREGMGYGDVRLMGFIGLFVGIQRLFLVVLIGAITASVYGIILLKIRESSQPYPFGPFLNIGGVIALLWGTQVMNWYIDLF